ncbi:MAG: DUF1971 domain-containing protein [Sphingomonadaceae bacterium]
MRPIPSTRPTSVWRLEVEPYRSTPIFDENNLPAALRREHRTKAGVWGIVRVIEGQLKLSFVDPPSEHLLSPDIPGLLLPDQLHFVEPVGAMRMQVDFYTERPMP